MLKKSLKGKSYRRLLKVIGASPEPLSRSEIMYKMRDIDPTSDWRYVYEMLEDLYPTNWGNGSRYFCLDDIISQDQRASSKLMTKMIKEFPPNYLGKKEKLDLAKKKDTCKTYISKNSKKEITNITVEGGSNNSVHLQPPFPHSRNPDTPLTVTNYIEITTIINNYKYIIDGYLRKKGRKTYAHGQTYGSPYLDLTRIDDRLGLASDPSGTVSRYRLNLRGLMLLLLSEEDPEQVNCVLKNLAKTDNDIHIKRDFNGLLYTVKENYPFLSIYFEKFLEVTDNFAFHRLKAIAMEIEYTLDKILLEELKNIVTRKFYSGIETRDWSNATSSMSRTRLLDLAILGVVPKEVSLYKLSILYYLRSLVENELFLIDVMIDDNKDQRF
ncbi:hypothetical protein [Nitrososphaera sp. AFS]|uniref:hypothetical protein n=1 Tax=Nitrososphaera sp. AFS TaxID=2301191 RepID=UPI00139223DB|nr:hypothetical protein [Nitrososphaera sp. AFS]NAL78049.1 hypothetical protein [Nitrososphaera sp. AFS]